MAWRGKDATCVGTDSQWSQGNQRGEVGEGKLWRHGRFVVAASGTVRSLQVLRHGPHFSEKLTDKELIPALVREWAPALITHFNDLGSLTKSDDKTANIGCDGLIVCRKMIIRFGADLTFIKEPLHYAAGGSGEEVALGYFAGQPRDTLPYHTVIGALKASARHCTGVSAPFHTEML